MVFIILLFSNNSTLAPQLYTIFLRNYGEIIIAIYVIFTSSHLEQIIVLNKYCT